MVQILLTYFRIREKCVILHNSISPYGFRTYTYFIHLIQRIFKIIFCLNVRFCVLWFYCYLAFCKYTCGSRCACVQTTRCFFSFLLCVWLYRHSIRLVHKKPLYANSINFKVKGEPQVAFSTVRKYTYIMNGDICKYGCVCV